MILPFIPRSSCNSQMYEYVPACVNVTRKRVTPEGCLRQEQPFLWLRDDESRVRRVGAAVDGGVPRPSSSMVTFPDGGIGFAGSPRPERDLCAA